MGATPRCLIKFTRWLAYPLGDEGFFRANAGGKLVKELVGLWLLAAECAKESGMAQDEVLNAFWDGYNSYQLSAAPWAVLAGESILGMARSDVDVIWMLETTGVAFAAYGITPKFKAV